MLKIKQFSKNVQKKYAVLYKKNLVILASWQNPPDLLSSSSQAAGWR